jgi:hypothetical protein
MDITNVDDAKFNEGVGRIVELTGQTQDDAHALLLAYVSGAVDLALDQVAGDGPVPTSLTSLRADLFRWTCARANRIISERETEVLLRTPSSTARSVLTAMRAMYEEALRGLFVERMRQDVTVRASGNEDEGLTWTLEFTESSLFELALSEVRRHPIPRERVDTVVTRRRIEIPRVVEIGGDEVEVLDLLQITQPDE